MLLTPLFQQANTYDAGRLRQFTAEVFDVEGVIRPAAGALLVAPRAAGANMSVDVSAGACVVAGDDEANQGSYYCLSTAVENRPIGAAPGADSRIDLVVARVRDASVTGGVSSDWEIEVIPGAVAVSPVEPALPASAIRLGAVLVAAGTVSIDAAKITDRRAAAGNAAYVVASVVVAPGELTLAFGTPAETALSTETPAWLFDAASQESVSGTLALPSGWATFHVELLWATPGTTAGDVVWRLDMRTTAGVTGLVTGGFTSTLVTSPQGGQLQLVVAAVASNVAVPSAGRHVLFRVNRMAADAADTLANDAALVGVRFRKAL